MGPGPKTTAGRKAKDTLVFGEEQDINGFNTVLTCCNQLAAGFLAANEVLRGAFVQNNKGIWVKDIVTSASANTKSITYKIKPNAVWYWGGKKAPVTYKDFVYTLQKIDDPATDAAGRTGYSNINTKTSRTRASSRSRSSGRRLAAPPTSRAARTPTGSRCSPVCIRPRRSPARTSTRSGRTASAVATGSRFPTARSISNYTKGQGTVLKKNPFWFGRKAGLNSVVFKIITDTNTEEQAMRGGEVDAISPTFGTI